MKKIQITELPPATNLLSLGLALLLGPIVSLSVDAYTLVDLGPNVSPKAINNLGVVVGSNNTDLYPTTAFNWSIDSGFNSINGGTNANAINNNGKIAGTTIDGAFIGDRDWSNYGAFGINQIDEVSGYHVGSNPYQPRSLPYNPAIYSGNKWKVYDIAKLYPRGTRQGVYADRYIMNAINANGYTVGYKYRYGLSGYSAILIDTNKPVNDSSDVVYLPVLAAGRAVDINNNNVVVGTTTQAFSYDYNAASLSILPLLDGGLYSSANDINELNQIVGSSQSTDGYHAVTWDESGNITDLNEMVTSAIWFLSSATAINDNGDITGTGTLDGIPHGFVLMNGTISEPPAIQNEPPKAVASANKYRGRAPLTVNFDASNSTDPDGSIVSYAWDFMDGSSSIEVNPSHEFTTPGVYFVTLTITDDMGLTDSTQVEIKVRNARK